MKAIFLTNFLWIGFILTLTQAQDISTPLNDYQQSLNIFHQNELVVVISGQKIHDVKESGQWRNLLNSFLRNLERVKTQIPEYLIYKIEYQKDFNLVVEEVDDIVKYKVEDDQTSIASNQSRAILKDEGYSMRINFAEFAELGSINYEAMIESAIDNLGKKPSVLKHTYFPQYNYDFSFSKKEMIKHKKERDWNFVIPINGTIGLFRGKPIYELGVGIGFSIMEKRSGKYSAAYAFYSTALQYNDESQKMDEGILLGVACKFSRIGTMSFAFPANSARLYDDIDFRIGYTIQSKKSLTFSIFSNMGFEGMSTNFLPSFSFGYSF